MCNNSVNVKDYLKYDPDTGIFTWKKSRSNKVKSGSIAGYKNAAGYLLVGINYKRVYMHRLAFLFMGQPVPTHVDHINGIKDDNRWCNLRPCNKSQNGYNSKKPLHNSSGIKGVSWNKNQNKWHSYIYNNGNRLHLGYYDCIAHAACVRAIAEDKYHGEFRYKVGNF